MRNGKELEEERKRKGKKNRNSNDKLKKNWVRGKDW